MYDFGKFTVEALTTGRWNENCYLVMDGESAELAVIDPGDDVDLMTQQRLGLVDEFAGITRLAEGVRADHSQPLRRDITQPFAKARQAVECTLLTFFVKILICIKTRSDPHHLAQLINDAQLAMIKAGDQQMKTVGPKVHRGHRRICRPHIRCGVRGVLLDDSQSIERAR